MRRNLLLCFDAFGTLFRPHSPIFEQYGSVARKLGVKVSDEEVAKSFKTAFKEASQAHPNYGKATDMGATQWWTEVINNTFKSYHKGVLPSDLAPSLLHRFASKEGYELYPEVLSYFRKQTQKPSRLPGASPRVVVGVITNSDDRVPDILSSLGLQVNNLRHGSTVTTSQSHKAWDIDFCIMSYDVGVGKPDRRIFAAATDMLKAMLIDEGKKPELEDWKLLYVGDEVNKDAKGSIDAGWNAAIVDRGGENDTAYQGDRPDVEDVVEVQGNKVPILKDLDALSIFGGHYLLADE